MTGFTVLFSKQHISRFSMVAEGEQWLSGRVLDSRSRGPRVQASPASLRCILEQEH